VTSPDAADGARRADELLHLLTGGDPDPARGYLAGLTGTRDLVFLGAALTTVARSERHRLPPAQRAQANTRQMNLGALRDAARTDPAGLRLWLLRAAEEVLFLRSLHAAAAARVAADEAPRAETGR
jgi:hypothetical protein